MKVYLVKSNATGEVLTIFHSAEDAKMHQSSCSLSTMVTERTVFTGQANNPGFNR